MPAHTEAEIYQLIIKAKKQGRYLVGVNTTGSKPPIFCTSGLLWYRELIVLFDEDQPFYCFEPTPHTDIDEILNVYFKEIRAVQPTGPYILFGYCQSGYKVIELVCRLEEEGIRNNKVILIECYHPDFIDDVRKKYGFNLFLDKQVEKFINRPVRYFKNMQHLSFPNKIDFTKRKFKILWERNKAKLRKTNDAIDQAENGIEVEEKANHVFSQFNGNVLLVKALLRLPETKYDPYYGWSGILKGNIVCYEVEGNHSTIFRQPNVNSLAATLKKCIN